MDNQKNDIESLSAHLFWDVNVKDLSFAKSKKLIVQRVLQYGLEKDWYILAKFYGINEIAETAIKIKDLDRKSVSFISLLSNVPKERFLCYSITPLMPPHWNF
jgi:hypothetical protein